MASWTGAAESFDELSEAQPSLRDPIQGRKLAIRQSRKQSAMIEPDTLPSKEIEVHGKQKDRLLAVGESRLYFFLVRTLKSICPRI